MRSIVADTLRHRTEWARIPLVDTDFGFQLRDTWMREHGYSHYLDVWLFERRDDGVVRCVGRRPHRCAAWYGTFFGRRPPEFREGDFFPPRARPFGTHLVPVPARSAELETWQFDGEGWNATCGAHRRWGSAEQFGVGPSTHVGWIRIPREMRACSSVYDRYPFVFVREDGSEELRQGGTVIYRWNASGAVEQP